MHQTYGLHCMRLRPQQSSTKWIVGISWYNPCLRGSCVCLACVHHLERQPEGISSQYSVRAGQDL